MSRQTLVWILLGAVLVAGCALRIRASDATRGPPAADEQAYVQLAADLRVSGRYGDRLMHHPFHWAPATPALFATAEALAPSHARAGNLPSAALAAQVAVGTLAIAATYGFAAIVAGPIAGLAGAAAVAFYPPLIAATDRLTSEPLGALTLIAAALALAWAWRRGGAAPFALAGAAFGIACLARADLLLVALLTCVVTAALSLRGMGRQGALVRGAALLAGLLVIVGPWMVFASRRMRSFVPITDGGTSTLLVATYLPGNGTIAGFKRAYAPQARRLYPHLRHRRSWQISSTQVMDGVAALRPRLSRDAALSAALHDNIRRYVLGRPIAFAGLELRKTWRMWGSYYRASVHRLYDWIVWLHRVLALAALVGLVFGLWRARRRELALALLIVLTATVVNVIFVAEPRHNVRLMPLLIAAGAAGWALTASRAPAAESARPREAVEA